MPTTPSPYEYRHDSHRAVEPNVTYRRTRDMSGKRGATSFRYSVSSTHPSLTFTPYVTVAAPLDPIGDHYPSANHSRTCWAVPATSHRRSLPVSCVLRASAGAQLQWCGIQWDYLLPLLEQYSGHRQWATYSRRAEPLPPVAPTRFEAIPITSPHTEKCDRACAD